MITVTGESHDSGKYNIDNRLVRLPRLRTSANSLFTSRLSLPVTQRYTWTNTPNCPLCVCHVNNWLLLFFNTDEPYMAHEFKSICLWSVFIREMLSFTVDIVFVVVAFVAVWLLSLYGSQLLKRLHVEFKFRKKSHIHFVVISTPFSISFCGNHSSVSFYLAYKNDV